MLENYVLIKNDNIYRTIKIEEKGIKIIERKIKPQEMTNFVGCFLTGTAAEVTPVSQIDKYKFIVCDVIKDLSKSYQNLVRKKNSCLILIHRVMYFFSHVVISSIYCKKSS